MVKTAETPVQSSPSQVPGGAPPGGPQRLLLLDGHSMAFRAFFALPVEKFTTSTGQSTNAIYGFTSMLIKLLREEEPTHIAVAWDRSEPTFRHDVYEDYKAGRAETPQEFPSQVELMQELLGLLGVPSVSAPGFEADDVIATLALQAGEQGMEVLIASGDRDAFQLVTDDCTVLYPGKSISDLTRMTPERIVEKYGVPPERYRDLAALVGEKSDNLPGVPGVGPKTAAKWITKYGSVDDLVARAGELTGKAGQSFRDHVDDVLRNQRLNVLATDVEVGRGVADLTMAEADRAGIHLLFDNLEFASTLRDRLFSVLGEEQAEVTRIDDGFSVELSAPGTGELADWLGAHADASERAGLAVSGIWGGGTGEITGLAIATADGAAAYIDPTALDSGDDAALARWLSDPDRPKPSMRPRVPCSPWPHTVGGSKGSPATPLWRRTWCSPASASST